MARSRSLTKKSSKYFSITPTMEAQSKRSSISKVQISAPVELISTTNMISYTSPSLRSSISQPSPPTSSTSTSPTSSRFPPSSPSSSSASSNSGSDSEISSPDEPSPPPNHLSMYFTTPAIPARSKSRRTAPPPPPPAHPAPAPVAGLNLARTPSRSQQKMHSRGVRSSSPFGAELAKVAEMAEDIGVHIRDAEEEFMMERGLQKFSANDYAAEIGGVFDDVLPNLGAGWI